MINTQNINIFFLNSNMKSHYFSAHPTNDKREATLITTRETEKKFIITHTCILNSFCKCNILIYFFMYKKRIFIFFDEINKELTSETFIAKRRGGWGKVLLTYHLAKVSINIFNCFTICSYNSG